MLGPEAVYTYQYHKDGNRRLMYMPVTILGRFYLSAEAVLSDAPPYTIKPPEMSYCEYQPTRLSPSFLLPVEIEQELSLVILTERATFQVVEDGTAELQIPVTLQGQGTGTFPLPDIVTATYRNREYSIQLPANEVEVISTNMVVQVPLEVRYLTEQREAVYHLSPKSPIRFRKCPPGSPRNNIASPAAYHTLEYFGSVAIYQVGLDHLQWSTTLGPKARIYVPGRESKWLSLAADSTSSGDEIPEHIVSALKKYAFIVPTAEHPWNVFSFEPSLSLQHAVFVPLEDLELRGCGSIDVNEDAFFDQENFCNLTLGSCVGLPFYSSKRYPPMLPFGLSELSKEISAKLILHGAGTVPHLELQIKPSHQQLKISHSIVQEPYLYQAAQDWRFSNNQVRRERFCTDVWSVQVNTHIPHQELTATLKANVAVFGQGRCLTNFTVRCSSEMKVYPKSGTSVTWLTPGQSAGAEFTLSGEQAIGRSAAAHQCTAYVSVARTSDVPWSIFGKDMPSCSLRFSTYHGAFQNPCDQPEQALPELDTQVHYLPRSNLDRTVMSKMRTNLLPNFDFKRALSLDLLIGNGQEKLVYHLHELIVSCRGNFAVFDADSIAATSTPVSKDGAVPMVYSRELPKRRVLYFFVKKGAAEGRVSGCEVKVFARWPHVACPTTILVLQRPIIVNPADQRVALRSTDSVLELVYGTEEASVLFTMVACLVAAVILFCGVGSGHLILFIFRKGIPSKGALREARKSLREDELEEKRKWEAPARYLETGAEGSFYTLHNFKATGPLDARDLKSLKIAGTLKYLDHQLPIMFGHVKKIFTKKSIPGEDSVVWVQASSGMYLLNLSNVQPEYRKDFQNILDTGYKPSGQEETEDSFESYESEEPSLEDAYSDKAQLLDNANRHSTTARRDHRHKNKSPVKSPHRHSGKSPVEPSDNDRDDGTDYGGTGSSSRH